MQRCPKLSGPEAMHVGPGELKALHGGNAQPLVPGRPAGTLGSAIAWLYDPTATSLLVTSLL